MCTHNSALWLSAFRKFVPATGFGYFAKYGKTGVSLLVSFSLLPHNAYIYALYVQNLIHVISIVIQQNLWSHSLLCCTFYIHVYAYVCCNTHV